MFIKLGMIAFTRAGIAGLQLALKGGQVGKPDFFYAVKCGGLIE